MAKCTCCNRTKREVRNHGGELLCCNCMNTHNPKTRQVRKMDDKEVEASKMRIIEFESKIHRLKQSLTLNEQLFEGKTHTVDTVITGYWEY